MSNQILSVSELHVDIASRLGVVHAVRGVSWSVRAGEILGLVGESGCGKSITLRAIVGLLPNGAHVTGGGVFLEGQELTAMTPSSLEHVRGKSISMVFQEPMTALNPLMRVGEQIAEGPRQHLGYSRDRANKWAVELMGMVGIPDPRHRARAHPHELSGGMRQRVMIAIALSSRPKVILCDEPTTALDVTIQDQVLKLLAELCVELGVGIVLVSHDLAVVGQVCDRLTVMYAGQIVESGPSAEVLERPRHPYTLGLLRALPMLERYHGALVPIPGEPPDLVSPPPGCPFHPRCQYVQTDCHFGDFPPRPVEVDHLSACIHHANLEEAAQPRVGRQ